MQPSLSLFRVGRGRDVTLATKHACVFLRVCVCVNMYVDVSRVACVGRVAGCLPVFSLAELHTAAWQRRAGQLNSLDREKRAREGREGGGGGVRGEVEGH